MDPISLLAAFGGGAFGAALGALPAFILTGVVVLLGVGAGASGLGKDILAQVAFGPLLGPHVCFAGGAAAAAYAGWKGVIGAKQTTHPLTGLNRPDIVVVGGLFGVLGCALNAAMVMAGAARWTDTVAATVFLSGVCARFLFGRSGLFGALSHPEAKRFRPDKVANWLPWQQDLPQLLTIGLMMGIFSAFLARVLGVSNGGDVLGFGLAAASLIVLQSGAPGPVTHHIAITAALATGLTSSVLVGAATGIVAALVGELCSRLVLIHGDTYIDPPAAAIATVTVGIRVAEAAGVFSYLKLP